jgi:hypothetical protein
VAGYTGIGQTTPAVMANAQCGRSEPLEGEGGGRKLIVCVDW